MKCRYILALFVALHLYTLYAEAAYPFGDTAPRPAGLKEIIIVESNNYFVAGRYKRLNLPSSLFAPSILQLKDFVSRRITFKDVPDPEFFYRMMEWVSLRWEHDGKNAPPENASTYQILLKAEKEHVQYRCQDYAQTLCDILYAFGHVARVVSVQSKDAAYGSIGKGHVAVEAWSNTLGKWIFLDPQWCMYAKYKGQVLNFREISNLDSTGKLKDIDFMPSTEVMQLRGQSANSYLQEYKAFIANYFGTMQIPILHNGSTQNLMFQLQNRRQYLTFQGLPLNNMIFTKRGSEIYFEVNRTSILLSYTNIPSWQEVFDNVNTPDEYLQKLPSIAAKPEFALSCEHSMPWFSYFMVRLNGSKWTKLLENNHLDIVLKEGLNTIDAYAVNKAGILGTPTQMVIFYGTEDEFRKSQYAKEHK